MQRRRLIQAAGACALLGGRAIPAAAESATLTYDWRSLPFGGGGLVAGLALHPRESGLLYARTDKGGAYRWDAAAKSWTPLLDHLGAGEADLTGVLSVALDPADSQRVYLACGISTGEWTRKAALLASADRGATWQLHELDLRLGGSEPGRGSGERLQVDPRQGEVLLLGTTQDGLKKSTDRGRSFESLPFPGKKISLVLFDPTSAAPGTPCTTFYAGCQDPPGLYATRDGGRTFAREAGAPAQVPQRAVFGPDGTLYASFAAAAGEHAPNPGHLREGSVWKRTADGQWSDITPLKPAGRRYGYGALDVDRQGRIVTSMLLERWDGPGDELFLSTDGGAHWTALAGRSRHDTTPHPWLADHVQRREAMGHGIADARFDLDDPDRLVYGTEHGVWMTANLGAAQQAGGVVQWHFAVANLEQATALSLVSPSGGALLFAAMGDDLAGAAWDDAARTPAAGLFRPCRETVRSVDAAWLAPRVVARTAEAGTGGYVSLDGGASWRPFGASATAKEARGGHVAVSANGTTLVWTPPRQAALYSSDHGRTWSRCGGWPESREAELVPVADKAVDGVFYVHDVVAGQILVSVDGGESFTLGITGLPPLNPLWQSAQLIAAPGKVRDLWIALPDGLLHLPGLEERSVTIRTVSEAKFVALGKAAPGATYHSVYVWGRVRIGGAEPQHGLFRSDDAGATFRRLDDPQHRYGRLQALAADPLEHGTVYLGPRGRGVIVGRPRA